MLLQLPWTCPGPQSHPVIQVSSALTSSRETEELRGKVTHLILGNPVGGARDTHIPSFHCPACREVVFCDHQVHPQQWPPHRSLMLMFTENHPISAAK